MLIVSSPAAVAAATGYASHRLDFVSESYGGAKAKQQASEEAIKKKDSNETLWDIVRQETIMTVTTKRAKHLFHDDDKMDAEKATLLKDYKSKRELMDDYGGSKKVGLRHRSRV